MSTSSPGLLLESLHKNFTILFEKKLLSNAHWNEKLFMTNGQNEVGLTWRNYDINILLNEVKLNKNFILNDNKNIIFFIYIF